MTPKCAIIIIIIIIINLLAQKESAEIYKMHHANRK